MHFVLFEDGDQINRAVDDEIEVLILLEIGYFLTGLEGAKLDQFLEFMQSLSGEFITEQKEFAQERLLLLEYDEIVSSGIDAIHFAQRVEVHFLLLEFFVVVKFLKKLFLLVYSENRALAKKLQHADSLFMFAEHSLIIRI